MNTTETLQLSFEDRLNLFKENGYYDIKQGFPFYTSQEFFDAIFNNITIKDQVFRMPITGIEEPIDGHIEKHIYIQTQKIGGRLEHRALVEMLPIDLKDITFGSGIENITNEPPSTGAYISVKHKVDGNDFISYWIIKENSDRYGKSIYKYPESLAELKRIFENIDGVEFHY